ncbi:uncharacterized protein LOC111912580 isoform X2 [Lactuca sativa]|uniref:uncharacterized protein LOC111912580 isoform X2 n=1 Tax=Lactuca sativa TaxID=4236 RepID=UPI000CD8EFA5|nr:uncharacterized protein LOC111912580 isoform X2 [Lactuca sativa]
MSSLTVKMMAGSLPPVTESVGSNAKGPAAAFVKPPTLSLQVRVKEAEKLQVSTKVSRRDLALFLTAGSLSAVTLSSSPQPAEARMSKTEMKKMILEKFKKLREKIGLSKPETEENEKVPDPTSPTAKKEAPASPIPSEKVIPIPPLPNLQNDKKTVVEATILP